MEEHILFPGVRQNTVHAAQGVQPLGRGEFFAAKVGIGAEADHGAALLVHTHEQGDRGGVLIVLNGLDEFVGGFVLCVPAKEDIAAQVVGGDILHGTVRRAADEEQLAHLFLQGHGGEQVLHRLGGQFLRRGGGGRFFRFLDGGRLLRGGGFYLSLCAAGGETE